LKEQTTNVVGFEVQVICKQCLAEGYL